MENHAFQEWKTQRMSFYWGYFQKQSDKIPKSTKIYLFREKTCLFFILERPGARFFWFWLGFGVFGVLDSEMQRGENQKRLRQGFDEVR